MIDVNSSDQKNLAQDQGSLPRIIKSSQIVAGAIVPRNLTPMLNPQSGDMFYSNGTVFKQLPAGTNGQNLTNLNGVPQWSNTITGSTGSFAALNITSANASGATGTTASLGPTGALDGGPATATQNGWAVIYVAGVKCWIPVWR